MSFLQAVLSGIVQGVTEFLPISSSGHLVILHKLIGLQEPQVVFDIFLHLGTLIAIVIVFRKDIIEVFTVKKRTGLLILIGTVSTAGFILLFGKGIESLFGNVKIVGVMLIVTGAWLILGNFLRYGTEGLTGLKALLIGLAQGIATIPGISRSGATISTGLFLGLSSQAAVRFSFLLAIPAILAAFLLKAGDVALDGFSANYITGFIVSCIVSVLALKLLLRLIHRGRFHLFGIYCIVAGILTAAFL